MLPAGYPDAIHSAARLVEGGPQAVDLGLQRTAAGPLGRHEDVGVDQLGLQLLEDGGDPGRPCRSGGGSSP